MPQSDMQLSRNVVSKWVVGVLKVRKVQVGFGIMFSHIIIYQFVIQKGISSMVLKCRWPPSPVEQGLRNVEAHIYAVFGINPDCMRDILSL